MIIKTSQEWTTGHAHPLRVCKIFFREGGGMPGRTFVLNFESIFILLLCTHINKKKMGFWGGVVGVFCAPDLFVTVHR